MIADEFTPLVEELLPPPDVEAAWLQLCRLPHCLFFDSAMRHPQLGRYSFLAADPFEFLERPANATSSLADLAERCRAFSAATIPGLPPFQGGIAGLFSYDLNRGLEQIALPRFDEFQVPALALGFYDQVVAFDHLQQRAWIISHGFPELDPRLRRRRAESRLLELRGWLRAPLVSAASVLPPLASREPSRESQPPLQPTDLAPQFAVPGLAGLTSNFTAANFRAVVRRVVDYIHAGDVFQVNLAQRLLFPAESDSVALYRRLRQRNPATFAAYFDLGPWQLASASPERFLRVQQGRVETRPIKGTRRRTMQPEADLYAADDLRASEKDRAENVMIVDLLRNDLSRVCGPDSVAVTQLCELEIYQFVQHLVSAVVGELQPGLSPLDLLRASFPGGSITGAPKVRAMQIIAELEPTARGAYCGSLGYLGFDGAMDSSILIRTITAGRGWWQMPVGGGIVAQSDPDSELHETWHKATGLLKALN